MTEHTEYIHGLFVSYADADRAWVEGYLLNALTQAGVRFHSEAAFALGVPRLLEFERAVQQSQRTLLVLSPAYLAEGFNQFTDLLAQSYGLETATWPVIPLVLHPVELPPRLAMLTALDATDPAEWPAVVERLCTELQRPVPGPAPKPSCPYPGMVPFSEADRDRFFGRDEEVRELLERLRLHPFLTVIGPSGSGKSSLVFAGLAPALRESGLFGPGGWLVRTLRPGVSPLAALAAALDGDPSTGSGQAPANLAQTVSDLLAARPGARRLLLVADQFEELFTLAGQDTSARSDVEPFQQALLWLAEIPGCYVVLTVRADFYPDLMACPLWRAIQAHRFEVLPLDEDGLRQAIVRPAEGVGVFVETALVERLVADAGREPGVLPLVQETLVLLWERVERRFLPLRAYEALVLPRAAYGVPERTGLQVAMARRADATLAVLTSQQQAIARRIFLRLVQFGEGRADTRRQQPVTALRVVGEDPEVFDRTLEHLADNRMLTLSGEEEGVGRRVDIAHESLITGWPTLQEWLAERREAELTRRRLEGKAAEWVRLGRGSGGLLDEVELAEAERWLESPDAADLGTGEALPALVEASREAQEEAAAQRRRVTRFRLGALGAIAALVIVALGIGLWSAQRNAAKEHQLAQQREEAAATAQAYAIEQRDLAEAEATARAEAEAERNRAERQARYARSGQLAAQSQAVLEEHPQRSLLLAVEALMVTMQADEPRVVEAEQTLRQALANIGGRVMAGHTDEVGSLTISPDGRRLATGNSDGTVRLWDLTVPDPLVSSIVLHGPGNPIRSLAISHDNRWLIAVVRVDETAEGVWLWDLTATDLPAPSIALRGHSGFIVCFASSPDSHWLVTADEFDPTVRLWDLTAAYPAAAPIASEESSVESLAISPDSRWLATGNSDGTVQLWDLTVSDPVASAIALRGHEHNVSSVAFSPDNHWLVTASWDYSVRLWDLTTADPSAASVVLSRHPSTPDFEISPDGHWVFVFSTYGPPELFDLTAPDPSVATVILDAYTRDPTSAAFSPNGRLLITGSDDGTTWLWDLASTDPSIVPTVLGGHKDSVVSLAICPDNHWLVTGSRDGTARRWDLTAADPSAASVVFSGHEGSVSGLVISADSRWLITKGYGDPIPRLWDFAKASDASVAPRALRDLARIFSLAISPNGRWLVIGSRDQTARLWDLTTENPLMGYTSLLGHVEGVLHIAISPDNHWLVTGSWDNTARLWDLTAPNPAASSVVLRGHELPIASLTISPDSRWLVTTSGDPALGRERHNARLWDLAAADPATTSMVLHGHTDEISSLAFSPDSRWLVTGSRGQFGSARLWDLTAKNPSTASIELPGYEEGGAASLAFSPDNHWLVVGSEFEPALLWDLTATDPFANPLTLPGHEFMVTSAVFSPDSNWLATADFDGLNDDIIQLWDLTLADTSAAPIPLTHAEESRARSLAISPDSRWLAAGSSGGTVHLWDLAVSNPGASTIALRGHEESISSIAFSPDNHWLITGSWDYRVRLWDLTAADPSTASIVLPGHTGRILSLAIGPDSRWLVTVAEDDEAALLWNLRLDELIELACRTTGRNLTRAEWEQYFPGQAYRKTCEQWPLEEK